MTITIPISLRSWVAKKIIASRPEGYNRSEWMEELMMMGLELKSFQEKK